MEDFSENISVIRNFGNKRIVVIKDVIFKARLLIRHAASGKKYLYDILEIKKETSKSCQV